MAKVIIMAKKTNAVRLVEAAGIACTEQFYPFDPDDLRGTHAADALGLPHMQVFKTLVAKGARTGIHVFCIPVCCELDLKKAAIAAEDKKMELLSVKELLPVTGYIRGGCSPVGMKKQFPTHIHLSALEWPEIAVSAGERGHQILLDPRQLAAMLMADFVDIIF